MREMRLHIGQCWVLESMKVLPTSHLHGSIHVKEGKRARKEGEKRAYKSERAALKLLVRVEEGTREGGNRRLCAEISACHCLRVGRRLRPPK